MRRKPRAAPPDDSPPAVATGLLRRLGDEEPSSFAGILMRLDGSIELRVTRVTPAVNRVADQARKAGQAIVVHVVDGFSYSLAELEAVRDKILPRVDELTSRGVRITELGADIRANRVRVGIKDLTAEKAALVKREFAAGMLDVFEGGEGWQG